MRAVSAVVSASLVASSEIPSHMAAWQSSGTPCDQPDWDCLSVNTVEVPKPQPGYALVEMKASSVNPVNLDLVIPICRYFAPTPEGGCPKGTIGNDGSGVVVSTGDAECAFQPGDEVYGGFKGSYAQYALAKCDGLAKKPTNIGFVDAGALPVVAGTAVQCLTHLGLPSREGPTTVVITAGQGGTGLAAIQVAKAMGATTVITAATGSGIDYAKSAGADIVVDYHKQSLFDYLENDTVDLVFDNLGKQGTADLAMHSIRSGGKFLVLLGGNGGDISDQPKEGVDQEKFGFASFGTETLTLISTFFEAGLMHPITFQTSALNDVKQAWTDKETKHIYGKIGLDMTGFGTKSTVSV